MELKPADVFITHNPKDCSKVEPWVIALGAGGLGVWYDREHDDDGKVKLAASRALERSRLVIFFLSSSSTSSETAFQEAMLARQMKKPVLVIALEAVELADGWRSLLKDAPMIDIRQDGRRAAWSGILQVLQERRLKWLDPDEHRAAGRVNVRRSRVRSRRWVTAAVLSVLAGSLAYFGFLRPRNAAKPAPAAPVQAPDATGLPAHPPVVASDDEPTYTRLPELAKPMDTMQAKAVEHVMGSIASANRHQGLDAEHIDKILTYFADPAWIQDRGRQDKNGLKAYMKVRQIEWPRWLELIESIDIGGYDEEGILVRVRSSYLAEGQDHQAPITGVLNTRYTVVFSAQGQPAIKRVEGAAEQQTPAAQPAPPLQPAPEAVPPPLSAPPPSAVP